MTDRWILWPDDRRGIVAANLRKAVDETPEDAPYVWERKRYRKPRTNPQNGVLWGLIYPPLMEHMGLRGERDREELHEFFCGEYFGWREYQIMGKRKQRPVRTTTTDEHGKRSVLSTVDFNDYCDFVRQRAAEHGVYIEDPDPMHGRAA